MKLLTPHVSTAVVVAAWASAACRQPAPASDAWPAPRSSHVMTYHAGLRQVVMLGGADGAPADTMWGWDGARWHVYPDVGPARRLHFGLAYDDARRRLVLHGGFSRPTEGDPIRHGDTWEWDGDEWLVRATGGPGVRDHHAMTSDASRGVVVLFGGNDPATNTPLGDTWEWDGERWRERDLTGPPPRSTHRLAYDAGAQRVVLFGGFGPDGLLADAWSYDGTGWAPIDGSGPSARFATRVAFDEARRELVVFGGRGGDGNLGDTWVWRSTGQGWSQRQSVGPVARNVHGMAYDAHRQVTVMFGGYDRPDRFSDVWEWDGATWREIAPPDTLD